MDNYTAPNLSTDEIVDIQLLISNSYGDYIAARCLLNNRLIKQGITLASSAIEKYLKAYLQFFRVDYKNFHLDNISAIEKYFNQRPYLIELVNTIDKNFLLILSKAYKWRYYDKLEQDSIGFVVNQFIGELDYQYSIFENCIEAKEGSTWVTVYQTDVRKQSPMLFENNFVLAGIAKQEFMSKPDGIYFLYYNSGTKDMMTLEYTGKLHHPYNGRIQLFNAIPGEERNQITIC